VKDVAEQAGLATGRETRYGVTVVRGHPRDDPTCDLMPSKPSRMASAHEVLCLSRSFFMKGQNTMPSTTSDRDMAHEVLMSLWQTIREQLQAKQNQIYEEIAHYPPPIPACDQHFNYLLEQRTGIAQELRRQKALAEESLTSRDPIALIREFVASSVYMNDETRQHIRSCLQNA
jgi:hypothetical protein